MFNLVTRQRNPWSVFDELESLQADMNRLFSGPDYGRSWRRGVNYPLMNVWSSKDGVVVDAELPGIDPKDVDVSVHGNELIVRGTLNSDEARDGKNWHRRERYCGEFVRAVQLPFRADAGGVKANFKKGVLRVTVPRSEKEKPRKIAVEAS